MPQRLAQHLISKKLLAAHLVDEGLKRMQRQGGGLDTVLLEMQVISEPGMLQAISDVSGVRLVNLADFEPNAEAAAMMPLKMSKQLGCVPLSLDGNALHLACSYPIPSGNLKDAGFLLGRQLELWVALEARIRDWQHVLYGAALDPRYLKLLAQLDPSRPRVKADGEPAAPPGSADSVSEEVKAMAKRGVVQEPILLSAPKKPKTVKVTALEVVPVDPEESQTNVVDVTAYGRFAKSSVTADTSKPSVAADMSAAFEESESTRLLDISGYANLAKELTKEQQLTAAEATTSGLPVAGLFPGGVMPPRASGPEPKRQSQPLVPAIAPLLPPLSGPTSPSGTQKMPAFSSESPKPPPPPSASLSDKVIVSPSVLETTQSITVSPEMAAALHREQLTAAAARTQDEDVKYTELEKQVEAITKPQGTPSITLPRASIGGARAASAAPSASAPSFIDAKQQEEDAERTSTWLSMRPKGAPAPVPPAAPLPPPPDDPEKTSAFLSMRPKGEPPPVPPPLRSLLDDPDKTSAALSMRPKVSSGLQPAIPPIAPVISQSKADLAPVPEDDFSSINSPVPQPIPAAVAAAPVISVAKSPSQQNLAPVAATPLPEDDFSDINAAPVQAPPPPPPAAKSQSQQNLAPVRSAPLPEDDFSDVVSNAAAPVPANITAEIAAFESLGAENGSAAFDEISIEDADNVLIPGDSAPAPVVPPEPEQVVPQPSPNTRFAAPRPSQQTILPAPPGLASSSAMEWTLAQARASLAAAASDREALVSVVLEYGRRTFDFVAAFAVLRGAAWGWDMRGEGELESFRSVGIPLDVSSMFRTVAMTRGSYVGPPLNDPNTQHYLAAMGRAPRAAFVWPIEVQSRLVAMIYGDCGSKPVSQRRLTDFILFCQELPAAFHELILVRKNALAEAQAAHHTPVPSLGEEGAPPASEEPLDASVFSDLLKLLTGPDASERNAAMVELMRSPVAAATRLGFSFPGPTAWSRLPVEQLPEADELGPVPGALARLGQPGAAALAPLLLSPDGDTRYLALLTAGSLPWPEVVDGVVRGLFDEEPDISSAARAAATSLKHDLKFQQALPGIRAELSADDTLRRSLAARALGVLHDRNSIEALAARVEDEDPMSSGAAIDALKEITRIDAGANRGEWLKWWRTSQNKRRIEWVVEALGSTEFECRLAAIEELSRTFGDTWGYSAEATETDRAAAQEAWAQFVESRPDLDL